MLVYGALARVVRHLSDQGVKHDHFGLDLRAQGCVNPLQELSVLSCFGCHLGHHVLHHEVASLNQLEGT